MNDLKLLFALTDPFRATLTAAEARREVVRYGAPAYCGRRNITRSTHHTSPGVHSIPVASVNPRVTPPNSGE